MQLPCCARGREPSRVIAFASVTYLKTAAQYRDHAAQCRTLAARMDSDEHREALLKMAETWIALAEQREALGSADEEARWE